MKINHQAVDAYARTSQVSAPSTVDRTSGQEPTPPEAAAPIAEAASVTISPEARALAAGSASTTSSAKVQHLRDQVNNGTFQVDSQLVAKRMLNLTG